MSFIFKSVNSDGDLVSFCARHAILYGCMLSPLGRSALHCTVAYDISLTFSVC